jgi:hypothetical protein
MACPRNRNIKTVCKKSNILLEISTLQITSMHALQLSDLTARLDFCNYYLQSAHDAKTHPELKCFTDEAWFYMDGYTNTQNNRH